MYLTYDIEILSHSCRSMTFCSTLTIWGSSAVFLAFVAVWLLLSGSNISIMGSTGTHTYVYQSVPGYFAQDESSTEANSFDYHAHNFGLLDRDYPNELPEDKSLPQWRRFEKHITALVNASRSSDDSTQYKVIYLGRHGEGFHNVGEAKYGTQAWDDYWSKLDGDGELYWKDARLTEIGKGQALLNSAFLKKQLSPNVGMPAPQAYFTSPLYRCLQTANVTYAELEGLPADRPFAPMVKELMREVMGEHTCDRRSTRSVIHHAVPKWRIESGFTEEDELWQADHRETYEEHDLRTVTLLDDVFSHAGQQHLFLSFTSHSGAIASLLRVTGHVEYKLPTGGMMPILIKATRS